MKFIIKKDVPCKAVVDGAFLFSFEGGLSQSLKETDKQFKGLIKKAFREDLRAKLAALISVPVSGCGNPMGPGPDSVAAPHRRGKRQPRPWRPRRTRR